MKGAIKINKKSEKDAKIRSGIGYRIRSARKKYGLTLDDIAVRIGVECATVSRWERGTIGISIEKVPCLCEILHITSNELLSPLGEEDVLSAVNRKQWDNTAFGKKLKERRNDLGLSVENVARAIGITRTTAWHWEKGDMLPAISSAAPLGEIFEMDVSEICMWGYEH